MPSIARAIVEPRELLLIDEPTKGLSPAIVGSLIACLNEIKATGVTILLVEQNFRVAREVGDEVRVMDNGRVVHRGKMAGLPRTKRCKTASSALASILSINDRGGRGRGAAAAKDGDPPALTPIIVALIAAPFIGSLSTFVTLTAAGLAMGMMIFTMASGLTLVFGMMDVSTSVTARSLRWCRRRDPRGRAPRASWSSADSLIPNLAVFILAAIAAALICGVFGWVFERLIVKPVYGQHLKQILATIGGSIIAEQLLYALFGAAAIPIALPKTFEGSFVIGEAAIEKYRVLATLVGLAVFLGEMLVLNRTKIGLLIRAGVENREMVEALGYRVDRLFVAVFMAGSALAGLGGAMMALYRGQVHATIGGEFLVLCFIVIIIGGLGSVGGSFVASILVALIANYAGFLVPKLALVSNILAMVAVLLWRPRGLYPVSGR